MMPNEKSFLDLIAWSEGTSTSPITKNNGYDVIVNGVDGPEVFDVYVDHPFAFGRPAKIVRHVPLLTSTASGRYQVLLRYWHAYKQMLNLPDFSPASQDAVALKQMKEQGACTHLANCDIESAIKSCANIWASLPGNDYGQGGHTLAELVEKHNEFLANDANQA
jgi:muramidase (phage lysozyme)